MGSLADAIRAAQSAGGLRCGVSLILATLSPTDRADLDAACADPTIQHSAIALAISQVLDRKIDAQTISRHRRGLCACPR